MINIPDSYLKGLSNIPENNVAIIMRHAERFEIKKGEVGLEVGLTPDGRKSAFELGKHLIGKIENIYSSYVQRCMDTGIEILKGAQSNTAPEIWPALAGDKIFINDFKKMSEFYMSKGMLTLLDLAYEHKTVEGLNNVENSVKIFISKVLKKSNKGKITLFITHDMFISLITGEIFRHKTTGENWPRFMEPIFIWKENEKLKFMFRELRKEEDYSKYSRP